jgi:signal transduction histidine kinase
LKIVIEDDGVGLETTGQSQRGNGHGLALHSTMLAVVGGMLAVESKPGAFTRVALTIPQGK